MEVIDKSAVVAEINKRINEYNTPIDRLGSNNIRLHECKDLLSFLDTLEVKEVENPNDAFIEKAIGWIDYNNREGGCNFDGWEKDFKKHMEGE